MSQSGNYNDKNHFRVRTGKPKQRGDTFIAQVLRQTGKAGNATGGKRGKAPGSRLGRGHVAARFADQSLTAWSRRVTVKVRLVYLQQASARSTVQHLRYIEREGVDRQGGAGRAYASLTDEADTAAFEERGRADRHQFRFIISPEDADQLEDLRTYTRYLMSRMEADVGTRLDWVAVDHWNTDNPHTHVVMRGKDDTGKDLIISQDYITRGMRERGDIIRTMQRAMSGKSRELAVFQAGENGSTIVGRVAAKGLDDKLYDKDYLVIDGIDGKAHYVVLPPKHELQRYPMGAVVEVKGSTEVRAADKTIATLAKDGLYRTDQHLAITQRQSTPDRSPQEIVAAHVRRLETLHRAGIVERISDGHWKIPADMPERGRQYDAQRTGGVAVELKSHLPIERQTRIIGATWLDQQLISGGKGLGDLGFGSEAKHAMQQRADFLVEQGLADKHGQRVILARNLLATLRNRELAQAAKNIATETGLEHHPAQDGQRVSGIYRRNVMLASGRYAMLDDGMGFTIAPWKPVIEQRLGQQLAATVRGGTVLWEFGRGLGR